MPRATLTSPPPSTGTSSTGRKSPPPRSERQKVRQKVAAQEEAMIRLYTLYTPEAELHAWSDGAIALYRRTATGPSLVVRGKASVPWFLARQECTCDESVPGRLVMRWGEEAIMEIHTTDSPEQQPEWSKGLKNGFHVSFSIRQPAHPRHRRLFAELTLNLESAGNWYGGGHLMRQHWPLEKGLWEVGPHYPFDNGPNGVNTLVGGHFVTSNGLVVATDPDTPFLHVGLNCPPPRRSWISGGMKKIKWGVGIQNFTRQILPLDASKGVGDGMLRLQARGNYESRRISHPLEVWETPVEFGHEIPASQAPPPAEQQAEGATGRRRTWEFRDGHVLEVCTDSAHGTSTSGPGPQGLEAEELAVLACAVNPALAAAAASVSSEPVEFPPTIGILAAGGGAGANGSGGGRLDEAASHPHASYPRTYQTSHHGAGAHRRVRRLRVEPGDGKWLTMHTALCIADNVKEAAKLAHNSLPKPKWSPPEEMIRKPIWTTWAKYKAGITQEQTERFASEIVSRSLPRSVMEIDDRWQAGYGELDFDKVKFPDPKAMVDRLHEMGFKVTLWVMPFCEENTEAYQEGSALGHFVRADTPNGFGFKPGFFPWWNSSPVVALDVTSPAAVQWFTDRLRGLQTKYGIDGFKFDAGEPCFLPREFKTMKPLAHPCEYTRGWVRNVASQFELAEVRTGHYTTDVGHLTRMGDRFSEWGLDNGLHSTITTLLTSAVLGYPFCLPDMIGGNAYFGRSPNTELMVRWAQANVLMPAVQFSIPPWDMSEEAERLISQALGLRATVLDEIVQLSRDACRALEPVCRPMWWLDPTDPETFPLDDQFTVGDNLIVAPVVVKGATSRDVYLTRGRWRDVLRPLEIYEGPRWIRNFPAPLEVLPCFQRVEESLLRLPPQPPGHSSAVIAR